MIRLAKRDIFFALDSRSIREEFAAMHPNRPHYPGHSAFLAELAAEPKDTHWKTLLERRYGIEKRGEVTWYGRIADRMRERKVTSKALDDVLTDVSRLAFELEAPVTSVP